MTLEELENIVEEHNDRFDAILRDITKANEDRQEILQQDMKQLKLQGLLSIVIFLMMLANGFMTLKIHMGW